MSLLAVPPGAAEENDEQGGEDGTVEATVEAAAPPEACILLNLENLGEDRLDFGVVEFEGQTDAPPYEIESCSSAGQTLIPSSTDATAGDDAEWNIDAGGEIGENLFALDVSLNGGDAEFIGDIEDTGTSSVGGLDPDISAEAGHTLYAPEADSDGAGEQLGFDLTWLATVEPQWFTRASVSGTQPSIQDVTFIDDDGWAITLSGDVWSTTDGGVTWNENEEEGQIEGNTVALEFVDSDDGWVVGWAPAPDNDPIIKSSGDGGQSWNEQELPEDLVEGQDALRGVSFVDEDTGWAVGSNGLIVETNDGGDTWEGETVGDEDLQDVSFLDQNTGWAVGDEGTVLHTTDGGNTWDSQPSPADESGEQLTAIEVIDDQTAWAVGFDGELMATTDAGEDWTSHADAADTALLDVEFGTERTGWAVGALGTVLHTTDGGESWEPKDFPTDDRVDAVHAPDLHTAWVGTQPGEILTYR